MSKTSIFLLCILALSISVVKAEGTTKTKIEVAAFEGNATGQSEDDYNESSDIARTSDTANKDWSAKENSYKLQLGEELVSEEVLEGSGPKSQTVKEVVTVVLPDGRIEQKTITKTITASPSKVVKTVKKYWSKSVKLDVVLEVVKAFGAKNGQELTEDQLTLFNALAAVDGNKYYSKYEYLQVPIEKLGAALQAATSHFIRIPTQEELDTIELAIRNCESNEPVTRVLNTDFGEIKTATKWKINTEILFSTCGKGKPGVQIFGWSGSKIGGWNPGMFSEPNAETVDALMTQWLYRNLYLLVTCKDVPVCKDCGPDVDPKNTWSLELKITYKIALIKRDAAGNEISRRYVTYNELSPTQKAKFDIWWEEQRKKAEEAGTFPTVRLGAGQKADEFVSESLAGEVAFDEESDELIG